MNVSVYRLRTRFRTMLTRLKHPPPLYKKVGGINAVVNRADGSTEDLGRVSTAYAKRWGTGTGTGEK